MDDDEQDEFGLFHDDMPDIAICRDGDGLYWLSLGPYISTGEARYMGERLSLMLAPARGEA